MMSSKRDHLPFVPDPRGICVVTGLTKDTKDIFRIRHGDASFEDSLNDTRLGGLNEWDVFSLSRSIGSRKGFEEIVINGIFPRNIDPSLVYVSFGEKLQHPIQWNAREMLVSTAPVDDSVRDVLVSVSFDGGKSFTSEPLVFHYSRSVDNVGMNMTGSTVFSWGTCKSDRSCLLDSTKKLKNMPPLFCQKIYPTVEDGNRMLLQDFVRRVLGVVDTLAVKYALLEAENDGEKALDIILKAYDELVLERGHVERDHDVCTHQQALNDHAISLKYKLENMKKHGMQVREIACGNDYNLVLLDNGALVWYYEPCEPGRRDHWMSLDNESEFNMPSDRLPAIRIAETRQETANSFGSTTSNPWRKLSAARLELKRRLSGADALESLNSTIVMLPPEHESMDNWSTEGPEEDTPPWFFGVKTKSFGVHGQPQPRVHVFPRWQQVSTVAAGKKHFCAVTDRMNGYQLYTWGNNSFGQLGIGTSLSDTFITYPSKVEAFEAILLDDKPPKVTNIACGSYTTMCTVLDSRGKTQVYSWGEGGQPGKLDLQRKMLSSGGNAWAGTFAHDNSCAGLPVFCLEFSPENTKPKQFWSDPLTNWLVGAQQSWSRGGHSRRYHKHENKSKEEADYLNKLSDVLSLHFRMKQAYIDDLEHALNPGDDPENNLNNERDGTDCTQKELETLLEALKVGIEFIKETLEIINPKCEMLATELRATRIGIKVCEDLARKDHGKRLKAHTDTVITETLNSDTGEPSSKQLDKRSSRGSVLGFLRRKPSTFKEKEEPSQGEKKGRKRSVMRFGNLSRSGFFSASSSQTMQDHARGEESTPQEEEVVLLQSAESENIKDDDADVDNIEGDPQDHIHVLRQHANLLEAELQQTEAFGDDIVYQLEQMKFQEKIFSALITDWQLGSHSLPLEQDISGPLGDDDFEIVLDLLEDAQSLNLAKMAEKAQFSDQVGAEPGGSYLYLFSGPGALVRESVPQEYVAPNLLQSKGLIELAKEAQSYIGSISEAINRFELESSEEDVAGMMLEMADDICSLKQVYLHGVTDLCGGAERVLNLPLAKAFAGESFEHVPSMRRDIMNVNSPFS
uniref:Uncharacterized protein n=1 Tax=Mucochytrium quahogii TaxID=96639 RepID=A0A7S2WCV8_9STRA|mmetsp:Transcript_20467/g.44515  ORF Transcript_20467/g.44515 Transcript_20467/m.44515 type:complete len:1079 (+) Transcript_20467:92-3328(+)